MIRVIALIFFIAASILSHAQGSLSTRSKKAIALYTEADNYRVRGQYTQAISLLQQAIEKDKNFVEAYYRLGLTYKTMRDFNHSNLSFEKGLSLTQNPKTQKGFFMDLGDNYLRLGDYEKALKYLNHYLSAETMNKQRIALAELWKRNAEYGLRNKKTQSQFQPRQLDAIVNSFGLQYFPVLTADEQELIFTRRMGPGPDDDEDLVVSKKDENGNWTTPVSISENINSKFNEGTCTISADGRTLIFTSCIGRRGYGNCDLFYSRKVGDEWSFPVNIGPEINSSAWESQPSLSADGRVLYFISDRRGGIGGRDIYVSQKDAEGNWSKAEVMPQPINTPFDEISPFIHVNGRTLFYATNGKPGFGGFDIFRTELTDGKWEMPVNFGSPVNDHEDQFSLFITADGTRGYYSHEDGTRENSARLYEMTIPEELQIAYRSNFVKGVVKDRKSELPLQSHIELFDLKKDELVSVVESDSVSGQYLMVLTTGSDYALYVTAPNYLFQSLNFNYEDNLNPEPVIIDILLDKTETGATVVLNNIFFDFDQYELKERSITELSKVIRILNDNPNIHVEIGGHTDSDGSAAYNKQLSLKRAQSVVSYLVEKGINRARLSEMGYGADRPIRPNDSDENKQANRRIEFKIIQNRK
ncbi:MAG TPA: OmpA family protein [Cyclobacteriaceae bacterium]|nr:OmpA family protein [Cyclobacteriaceae bacterium]HRK54979.1 OmpA family protein [Cyclobacteriaceae bacterium]